MRYGRAHRHPQEHHGRLRICVLSIDGVFDKQCRAVSRLYDVGLSPRRSSIEGLGRAVAESPQALVAGSLHDDCVGEHVCREQAPFGLLLVQVREDGGLGVDKDLGGSAVEAPLHSLTIRLIVEHVQIQIASTTSRTLGARSRYQCCGNDMSQALAPTPILVGEEGSAAVAGNPTSAQSSRGHCIEAPIGVCRPGVLSRGSFLDSCALRGTRAMSRRTPPNRFQNQPPAPLFE